MGHGDVKRPLTGHATWPGMSHAHAVNHSSEADSLVGAGHDHNLDDGLPGWDSPWIDLGGEG